MLELAMPVLPHRLNDDWRKVVEQMDFLDIPGMRAGRQGAEQGKRTTADTLEEQMEIVKLQILQQTGTASLAQANSAPQSVLALFG